MNKVFHLEIQALMGIHICGNSKRLLRVTMATVLMMLIWKTLEGFGTKCIPKDKTFSHLGTKTGIHTFNSKKKYIL